IPGDACAYIDFHKLRITGRAVAICLLDDLGRVCAVDNSAFVLVHCNLPYLFLFVADLYFFDKPDTKGKDRDALVHQIKCTWSRSFSFEALANVSVDAPIEPYG